MDLTPINITEYQLIYQSAIDKMMEGIAKEFAEPISSPQSIKLYEAYQQPGHKYWVALHGNRVVGTVGLILLANHKAVVKRMMTDKAYRGQETQLAKRLLDTAIEWGIKNGTKSVFLGTMTQFIAAQNFYRKNGFVEIPVSQMPADDKINPIDTIFFVKQLS